MHTSYCIIGGCNLGRFPLYSFCVSLPGNSPAGWGKVSIKAADLFPRES